MALIQSSGCVKTWSVLVILKILVQVTLTVGGEKSVRISTTPITPTEVSYWPLPRHPTNIPNSYVTQPFPRRLASISSPSAPSPPPPPVSDNPKLQEGYSEESQFMSSISPQIDDDAVLYNSSQNSNTTSTTRKKVRKNRKEYCSNLAHLDRCLGRLPPMPDIGIPSSPAAVERACAAFNQGMYCVDQWTAKCLFAKEKVAKLKASISGAHEMFTFLCRDQQFRAEYLTHGDCYRKISGQWDDCSKHFIENLKRFHSFSNSTVQCWKIKLLYNANKNDLPPRGFSFKALNIRLSFLQCVGEISSYHCDRDAAKFLLKMAETLLRATMRSHVPPQCVYIQHRNCTMMNSIASPSIFSHRHLFSLFEISFSYYSINVLISLFVYFFSSVRTI